MSLSDENRALLREVATSRARVVGGVYTVTIREEGLNRLLDAARLDGFRQAQDEDSPMWRAQDAAVAEVAGAPVLAQSTIVEPKRQFRRPFRPGDLVVANHNSPYQGKYGYMVGDRFEVEEVNYSAKPPVVRLAGRPDGVWSGPGGFDLVEGS